MLKPKAQLSLGNAREYFREHLCIGDYYAAGHSISGEWFGLGAERLSLTGRVEEQAFLALCEGRNPGAEGRLGARKNSVRQEGGVFTPNRRIFFDFTISPPKSVSVVALCRDPRIAELHNGAVRRMLAELEPFAGSRVRKSGDYGERVTGNIAAACFRHDTSREMDPHLLCAAAHRTCYVVNRSM